MEIGDVGSNPDSEWDSTYKCRKCKRWVKLRDAEDVGECSDGCCDDYKCPHCGHVTRVEWPD